jgi:phosphoglycolate phosphatase
MRSRRKIRGVLLDKDGTLIDCDATWGPIVRQLAVELRPDGDVDALVEAAGLDPETGRLRAGSVWAAGSTRDLVRLWWPDVDPAGGRELAERIDATCAALSPSASVPLLELPPFLDELRRRGLTVGIATNDSIASLNAFAAAFNLTGRVEHLIGYDTVARPKPAPDMVHAFCDAAALTPPDIAVVGDNAHDLEMAHEAGAGWAIGVLSGNSTREHLEPIADIILDGLDDLLAWLDQH